MSIHNVFLENGTEFIDLRTSSERYQQVFDTIVPVLGDEADPTEVYVFEMNVGVTERMGDFNDEGRNIFVYWLSLYGEWQSCLLYFDFAYDFPACTITDVRLYGAIMLEEELITMAIDLTQAVDAESAFSMSDKTRLLLQWSVDTLTGRVVAGMERSRDRLLEMLDGIENIDDLDEGEDEDRVPKA